MEKGKRYQIYNNSKDPIDARLDPDGPWLYDPDRDAVPLSEHCEALKKVAELTVENSMARIVQTVLRRELKRHQAFNEINGPEIFHVRHLIDRRKHDLGTHIHRPGLLAAFYDGSLGTLKVRFGDKKGE